jgi:hypothetical protein
MSTDTNKKVSERKPNEVGGFHFSSGIKIFDPVTKEIILQKRGDN